MVRIRKKKVTGVGVVDAQDVFFDVVNEDDQVVGKATRGEVHGNPKLIHRSSHIFVVNVKGEIFLHQRSERKDLYPGYWNSSASGHLDLGESYDGAATRELGEELPNVSSSLKKVGSFKTRDSIESENSMLYVARHDGEVQFNRDEVAGGRFISVAELRGDIAEGRRKFTPGFLAAFKLYCEAKGV